MSKMFYYKTDVDFKNKVDSLSDVEPYFVTVLDRIGRDRSYNNELMYVTKEDKETIYCYSVSNVIYKEDGKLLSKRAWKFTEANDFFHPPIVFTDTKIKPTYVDNPEPIGITILEGISKFTISRSSGQSIWKVADVYGENETHLQVRFRNGSFNHISVIPKHEYKTHDPEDYPEKLI